MRIRIFIGIIVSYTTLYLAGCGAPRKVAEVEQFEHVFDTLPIPATVNVNIANVYKEPSQRSEVVSQALYNENVTVGAENRRFALVRQLDGYQGWIRKSFLTPDEWKLKIASYYIIANLASAYKLPSRQSKRITSIPYGVILDGDLKSGFLRIESNRYGPLYIPAEEISTGNLSEYDLPFDSVNISREGEKFLGAPYLWGGKSFFGIDCSGFTQIIMERFRIHLPRDSKDQRNVGKEVTRDDIRAGDLLFFPHHVALAVSNTLFLHSTNSNGGVAYNSLDPDSPVYSEYHDKNLEMVRRVK